MSSLRVIRPGMLTTIQDLGRWGLQSSGVPVAGPMDTYSHRLANRLACNPDEAAALEVTVVGPELRAVGDVACAVAGARFTLEVDGRLVDAPGQFDLPDGATLRFGPRTAGARATLALRGGLDVPATFGSRATSMLSRMGPFGGRALVSGDELPIGSASARAHRAGGPVALPAGGARLRVVLGPHDHMFTDEAVAVLLTSRFVISPQSNRTGYRLDGPSVPSSGIGQILSDATPFGSIQVTGAGQPIVLMADRPTTGGYPKIATVITADLPIAGQLLPGEWIEFAECSRDEALHALRLQEASLRGDR